MPTVTGMPVYAEGVCLDCGRVYTDLSVLKCPCGGAVPLVHGDNTDEGRRLVKKEVARLHSDPAARRREKARFPAYATWRELFCSPEGATACWGLPYRIVEVSPGISWQRSPVVYEDAANASGG